MPTDYTPQDRQHNIGGTVLLGNAEGVIQLSSQGKPIKFHLIAVKVQRKSGASATNYQPRLSNVAGASATDIATFFQGVATAAGTMYFAVDIDAPFITDANGRVYLNLDGNVANGFEYEIWSRPVA